MVDSAVKQVREISHNLSPYLLRDAGVAKAIATHLLKIKDNETLQTVFENNFEPGQRLSHNIEVVIYRVFLELLNNTIKHAGADQIKIILNCTAQKVYFTYSDNGTGFNINKLIENKAGIGLQNITSRVKSLEGSVNFAYDNNEMIVSIIIPL